MGRSEGGTADEDDDHYHSDKEVTAVGTLHNDVYLAAINPAGDPASRPSRTRPLPDWMSLHQDREDSVPSSNSSTPKAISRVSTAIWNPIDEPSPSPIRNPISSDPLIRANTTYAYAVHKAGRAHSNEATPAFSASSVLPPPHKQIIPQQIARPTTKATEPTSVVSEEIIPYANTGVKRTPALLNEICDQDDQRGPSTKRRKAIDEVSSPRLPPSSCHPTDPISRYQEHNISTLETSRLYKRAGCSQQTRANP
jgi:hypothetical protein